MTTPLFCTRALILSLPLSAALTSRVVVKVGIWDKIRMEGGFELKMTVGLGLGVGYRYMIAATCTTLRVEHACRLVACPTLSVGHDHELHRALSVAWSVSSLVRP